MKKEVALKEPQHRVRTLGNMFTKVEKGIMEVSVVGFTDDPEFSHWDVIFLILRISGEKIICV